METYDLLYAPADVSFPETFMDWSVLIANAPFEVIQIVLSNNIKDDLRSHLSYAYRVVRYSEGGNII